MSFPTTDNSYNPACWPIDCSGAGFGPCASNAPLWSRAYNCSYFDASGASINESRARGLVMRRKAEVLQYKKNSANLTKKQKWAQFAKGTSHNKKQVWANQTDLVTNPNTHKLSLIGNILYCSANQGQPYTMYSSGASNVPGNSTLWLDRRLPPWGTGPQRRSFAMGNVMHTRSHPSGHGTGPAPPVPASTPCRQCTCNNNIGGWNGTYTDCIFWGDGPARTYGPFGCYACENGVKAITAHFLRHTESDPGSCTFNPDHCGNAS